MPKVPGQSGLPLHALQSAPRAGGVGEGVHPQAMGLRYRASCRVSGRWFHDVLERQLLRAGLDRLRRLVEHHAVVAPGGPADRWPASERGVTLGVSSRPC